MPGDIMLIGIGDLGNHILNFLARTPGISRIIAADFDDKAALCKVATARYGACFQGFYPEIDFLKLDLSDVEHVSDILRETRPSVICSTAVLHAGYLRPHLSKEVLDDIHAEYEGEACLNSLQLYCPLKLMQAVKRSGIDAQVINSSYPDLTHPVLKGMGLAPTCGGGNVALATGFIREIVSDELAVATEDVSILLVSHHSWFARADERIPYWVKILAGGVDVTAEFPPTKLCREIRRLYDKYPVGREGPLGESARYHQQWIASAFVQNILAIYFDTGEICHAPGPNGLPGGYPVRLSARGCEIYLPQEIDLHEAIEINEQAQRFDGIERIESDGTIVRVDGSALKPQDIEQTALHLMSIIRR